MENRSRPHQEATMRPSTATFALALTGLIGLSACVADAPTGGRTGTLTRSPLAVGILKTSYSSWSPALSAELAPPGAHPNFNTASLDGCPFPSSDGKMFFRPSSRPGGLGGIDIWV